MTHLPDRVAVIGASVASAMLIERSRELGFAGEFIVVDSDPNAPYDRPPLSKQFLLGTGPVEPAEWWPEATPILNAKAIGLLTDKRTVLTDKLGEVAADAVVISTGAGSIRLPNEPAGVLSLRTAQDALALRSAVDAGAASAIIIGAGTIGAELASTLAQRGLAVTVVDLAPQPMQRFFSGHLGEEAKAWMHQAGVVTHFGVAVESIQKTDAQWKVRVSGLDLHADLVISAVGARPHTEWLTYSELDISNGVRCTADGKALLTSGEIADGIFAIGDVSARQAEDGTFRRFESWTQAQRHGAALAEYFAGFDSSELEQAPYGWTEQFGRKVQVHGMLPTAGELVQVYAAEERNAALYRVGSAEEDVAWIGVNAPRQFSRASLGMSLLS
ncbi:NAD(P)/FAD-dependent oxidoreductase [Arthrobacter sp. P2b]|uniref:NAD(P)/FAD-dependent oxidoreductase n=1 Tax=Arthrobacter sp. P2b TaxID=1938741 RepID=UPI0009D2F826|nr:FAD-dependent oxidoreductase [Arthrobacter sp. P2b]SLK12792.1 3-phenylpropionate/trans-cinnamate dioxygenase ferredoxin reductase subunit [Arthrobacter sp. P2b]